MSRRREQKALFPPSGEVESRSERAPFGGMDGKMRRRRPKGKERKPLLRWRNDRFGARSHSLTASKVVPKASRE